MCRILAYLGEPLPSQNLLFDTDNSLVVQSYRPRMMNTFNLAGPLCRAGLTNLTPYGLTDHDVVVAADCAHDRLVHVVARDAKRLADDDSAE